MKYHPSSSPDIAPILYAPQPPIKIPNKCQALPTFTSLTIHKTTIPQNIHARAAKLKSFTNDDVMTISFPHQLYDFTHDVNIPIALSTNSVMIFCDGILQ